MKHTVAVKARKVSKCTFKVRTLYNSVDKMSVAALDNTVPMSFRYVLTAKKKCLSVKAGGSGGSFHLHSVERLSLYGIIAI